MLIKFAMLVILVLFVAMVADIWVNRVQHPEDSELQYDDE